MIPFIIDSEDLQKDSRLVRGYIAMVIAGCLEIIYLAVSMVLTPVLPILHGKISVIVSSALCVIFGVVVFILEEKAIKKSKALKDSEEIN